MLQHAATRCHALRHTTAICKHCNTHSTLSTTHEFPFMGGTWGFGTRPWSWDRVHKCNLKTPRCKSWTIVLYQNQYRFTQIRLPFLLQQCREPMAMRSHKPTCQHRLQNLRAAHLTWCWYYEINCVTFDFPWRVCLPRKQLRVCGALHHSETAAKRKASLLLCVRDGDKRKSARNEYFIPLDTIPRSLSLARTRAFRHGLLKCSWYQDNHGLMGIFDKFQGVCVCASVCVCVCVWVGEI